MVNRSSAMGTWRQVVGALSTHPIDRPTDLGRAVDQMLAKITNRCLIAIISDFFVDPDQIRAAFARVRHRGHDLIAFQVVDRDEVEFPFERMTLFEGLEEMPGLLVDPRSLRDAYLEEINAFQEEVRKGCLLNRIDYIKVVNNQDLDVILSSYLAHRAARAKRGK